MTDDQKELADSIVALYKEKKGVKIYKDHLITAFRNYANSDIGHVVTILEDKGILNCANGVVKTLFYLTEDGWKYENYTKLEEKEEADAALKRRKENADLVNAERIKSTYWWTFGLALAGFLISAFLLFLKLKEKAN